MVGFELMHLDVWVCVCVFVEGKTQKKIQEDTAANEKKFRAAVCVSSGM